ncbi:beta-galactosidase [Agaribacter flavus]|uniref:Beta-galactosidase n=1 Tax=Agaribacter flavus TaxID=1902781 RepID=A0ABV7FPG4_9ALTE
MVLAKSLLTATSRVALASLAMSTFFWGGALAQASQSEQVDGLSLFSFEDGAIPVDIQLINADAEIVNTGEGVTDGNKALRVKFKSSFHEYAAISFTPKIPYDWSHLDDFSLAFDIANEGDLSTQLYLNVGDAKWQSYTRSIVIPVGGSNTYYSKMIGHDLGSPDTGLGDKVELNLSSGLRSNPPTWESDDRQFVWMWGSKHLDTSAIRTFSMSVQYNLHDKEITLDNIRLLPHPELNEDYLVNIVDKFGQPSRMEYEEKVHSEEELLSVRDSELAELKAKPKIADRTKFSGWKDGPKFEATGYFRTEKVGDKWSLVDPEGYLFLTTGIANIRITDASTLTGYDYDANLVGARGPKDVNPAITQGLNPPAIKAIPSRSLVSETRKQMFEWLPNMDDPLASSYGYRPAAHSGPMKKGEVFSFYMANLERKYGETSPYSYLENWRNVTVDRMLSWGFTSFGNWVDPMFYDNNKIPYFANGWVNGNFKTVSSGNDFWVRMPDPFDPVFAQSVENTVTQVAREVNNSPWCVGVFIDNEHSWGRPESLTTELGIVINTLGRPASESPTKAVFVKEMKAKYRKIAKLNEAWGLNLRSWKTFAKGEFESKLNEQNSAQVADYEHLLYTYSSEYFRIISESLDKHMPNHMYMGVRFADWGMPKPVVKASAKHVDVVSFNLYKEGITQHKWKFLEDLDMPTVIGEFHMGTSASGFFHPGLIHATDQQDRARMYKDYMYSVLDNNYFVGAHWFQYLDSPISGRSWDGENYNVGFVSVTDIPYNAMVKAARELHSEMYERRFGDLKNNK